MASFQGFESAWSGSVRFGIGMGVNGLVWFGIVCSGMVG